MDQLTGVGALGVGLEGGGALAVGLERGGAQAVGLEGCGAQDQVVPRIPLSFYRFRAKNYES